MLLTIFPHGNFSYARSISLRCRLDSASSSSCLLRASRLVFQYLYSCAPPSHSRNHPTGGVQSPTRTTQAISQTEPHWKGNRDDIGLSEVYARRGIVVREQGLPVSVYMMLCNWANGYCHIKRSNYGKRPCGILENASKRLVVDHSVIGKPPPAPTSPSCRLSIHSLVSAETRGSVRISVLHWNSLIMRLLTIFPYGNPSYARSASLRRRLDSAITSARLLRVLRLFRRFSYSSDPSSHK